MSEKNLSVMKPRFWHLLTSLDCEEALSSLTRHGFPSRGLKRGPSCSDKQHRDGRPLLHLLDIFNLDCLIRERTRKTKTTETLLNLILTNDKKKVLKSGVVGTQANLEIIRQSILFCDHQHQGLDLVRFVNFHRVKNFSRENFVYDMQIVPFRIIDLFDELDDKLYAFEQLFLSVLNEHAPIKQTMIRGNQVPYMKEQWRRAIRHCNTLWKKFTHNHTDANYEA